MLHAGDIAPDFDLPVLVGGVKKQFRLSEQRGSQRLVLAFYPLNWEPVSSQQLVTYQVEREKFVARQAEVVGISVDHIMNATAWEREIGPFDFRLCSDFWPHGEVSRKYGVLRETDPFAGASGRAIFVIDKAGRIAFCKNYPMNQLPDLEETLEALRRS
ncbi:MAG TPA: redoxin domain-containing protein [Terriglobales bacterium]|nr:redoxin domain-containing protein [Terriglobales bacterium]